MNALKQAIDSELVDLGEQHEDFAGIYTPASELNKPKQGVTEAFLGKAEEYYERFESFDHMFNCVNSAFEKMGVQPKGTVLDFGAGFGNSTIPLLRTYDDINVVASDISPNLLAILKRLTEHYGVQDRCSYISCDLLNDYFHDNVADVTVGAAILHHLIDPMTLIRTAIKSLKPGGIAIFVEPFAEGNFIVRLIIDQISARYKQEESRLKGKVTSSDTYKAVTFLEAIARDIQARTEREQTETWKKIWRDLDDKWLFTRSYFHEATKAFDDVDVSFVNVHDYPNPYSAQIKYMLRDLAGLSVPDCLPKWAWEIIDEVESRYMTPELTSNFMIEGVVIFHKKA